MGLPPVPSRPISPILVVVFVALALAALADRASLYRVSDRWLLRGGYTFIKKDLSTAPGSNDLNRATAESDDPEHQLLVQSSAGLLHGEHAEFIPSSPSPRRIERGVYGKITWR